MSPNTVDEDILYRALETAETAAQEAGNYLERKRGEVHVIQKKALRDDLLDADLEAEQIIIRKLRAHFPDHDIISEEAGGENKDSLYRWVVDPLDGSFNFQHGSPTFAISISLLIDNITTVGVVYIPLQKEMFTAIRGHGARLNGQPIHVSDTSNLNDAIVHVGDFSKDGNTRDNKERVADIAHLADAVGRVRMIGTAATDLAYVACGRAEGLVIHNVLPWDIEVGCLLIREAKGEVSFRKSKDGKYLVVCSNGHIHRELLNVILEKEEDNSPEYGSIKGTEQTDDIITLTDPEAAISPPWLVSFNSPLISS